MTCPRHVHRLPRVRAGPAPHSGGRAQAAIPRAAHGAAAAAGVTGGEAHLAAVCWQAAGRLVADAAADAAAGTTAGDGSMAPWPVVTQAAPTAAALNRYGRARAPVPPQQLHEVYGVYWILGEQIVSSYGRTALARAGADMCMYVPRANASSRIILYDYVKNIYDY